MKESVYKTYDELPLFLNAETVAEAMSMSPSSGYELLRVLGFNERGRLLLKEMKRRAKKGKRR